MFEYGQIKSGSRSPSRGGSKSGPILLSSPRMSPSNSTVSSSKRVDSNNFQDQVVDYLVGSVHHFSQISIKFDQSAFHRVVLFLKRPSHALRPHRLIDRYRPEVIGYFGLCLIFSPDLDLQAEPAVWTKTERKIKHVISYGVVFEVNSALIRKGWSTPYPSPTTQNKAGHNTSNC
ncbi:hypothetical protein PSHT_04525 [Puccinia striiformis]|uniref:Histidinol-phosphatase n=1 Tax=Puccinia striiformis TaxID=27350 RepID=A0A2S4WCL7_9BASI|nr:hypothetical protein PSHT_04525 [Puccinia striiformis]